MTVLPELERLLGDAAERLEATATSASANGHVPVTNQPAPRCWRTVWRRRSHQRRAFVLIVVLVLGGTTAALAATGVFQTGTPVGTQPGHAPASSVGFGTARPGTMRTLALRVADPDGGPPWGLGVFITTRGVACPVAGRVIDGRLGVLGIDYAFSNDRRFHPFLAPASIGLDCAPPDARGHLFLTGQGWIVNASGDIAPEAATDQRPHCNLPGMHGWSVRCPQATLRALYYGFLGPQARSISYTYHGTQHTEPTSGANGGYLVVLPAPPGSATGRNANVGGFPAGPPLYATYTNGRTCAIQNVLEASHPNACTLIGYVQAEVTLPSPTQVKTTVHVLYAPAFHQGPLRFPAIQVTFMARVAAANVSSGYTVELQRPNNAACRNALAVAGRYSPLTNTTETTIAKGQTVRLAIPLRPLCAGRYTGRLAYYDNPSPDNQLQRDLALPPTSQTRAVTAANVDINVP
jgi:hypothetical protein